MLGNLHRHGRLWKHRAKILGVSLVAFALSFGIPTAFANTGSGQSSTSPPPVFDNWQAWQQYMSQNPASGPGCFSANYPNPQWQSTPCGGTTSGEEMPAQAPEGSTVGNINDYIAAPSTGALIGEATGSFPSVSGVTSETDVCAGPPPFCTTGGKGADAFSLQINSQLGFPVTFHGNSTTGWEQFVYSDEPSGFQGVWIEFWLFGYSNAYLGGGSCSGLPVPSGASGTWYGPLGSTGDCYFNSNATPAVSGGVPASALSTLTFSGIANDGGNDVAELCVTGGTCYSNSQPASFLNLYQVWNNAEFNVFGFIDGSRAEFNTGSSITVQNSLLDQYGNSIVPASPCPNNGSTGETNNLNLLGCSASSTGITFTESSFDYSIAATPSDATVLAGERASYSVTLTTLTGPASPVTLSISGTPYGAGSFFTTNPVTPTTSGVTVTLNVDTSSSGGLGDYALSIQGADGALTHSTPAALHVYDYFVDVSPSDSTVLRGDSVTYSVTLSLATGSTVTGVPPIALTTSYLPSDSTQNSLGSVTPTTSGATTSLTVGTAPGPGGSLGDFPFYVVGTGPSGGIRSGAAALHIYDFGLAVSPTDDTVLRGSSASYSVTLTLASGSSTIGVPSVALSASGLPSDSTPGFAPSGVTPTLGGASAVLTVNTGAPPTGTLGGSTFTVTGTAPSGGTRSGGGGLHIYDFSVTAAVSPASSAYACAELPAPCLYVLSTGSNSYSVNINLTPGSTALGLPTIGLAVSGLPSGATGIFTPASGTSSFGSTLTITASGAAPGTYMLTISGADSRSPEGGTRAVQASLVVVTPQQAIQLVSNQVSQFQTGGVLNKGRANSLNVKLSAAVNSLNTMPSDKTAACNQLSAFVNEVNAYVTAGILTPAQADLLLGGPLGINAIVATLAC